MKYEHFVQLDLRQTQLEILHDYAEQELSTNGLYQDSARLLEIQDGVEDCAAEWSEEIVDNLTEGKGIDIETQWELQEIVKQAIKGAYAFQKAHRLLDRKEADCTA